MSNVVFKGDSVKNFGEYLPVPYIEKVIVTNPDGNLNFELQLSVFFLADDEPNYENMENMLNDTIILYRWGFQIEDRPLTKPEVVGPTGIRSDRIRYLGTIPTDDFEVSDEELYDSEDRRVVKYSFTTTLFFPSVTFNSTIAGTDGIKVSDVNDVYLYLFTTIGPDRDSLDGPLDNRLLITSDVAYEKIMSKNMIIKKEEKIVYFDQEGTIYSQTPLLALDRNFYKTDTVQRPAIVQRVKRLLNRYKGGTAPGLNDAITSIEYVLSTEASTENLLVQLDKARRGFPNKTNNNPTGNLYASFAILLQNINSAFPSSERLVRDKYLTGKVSDLRTSTAAVALEDSRTDKPYTHYITMPLVDRNIVYRNVAGGLMTFGRANNTGLYLLDYENLVREKATIFKVFNVDRFFEVCTDDRLSAYKAALFSKFKIDDVRIRVFTHGEESFGLMPSIPGPGDFYSQDCKMIDFDYDITSNYFEPEFGGQADGYIDIATITESGGSATTTTKSDGSTSQPSYVQDITILNYNFIDSDRQTFAIKYKYADEMSYNEFNIDSDDLFRVTGQRHVLDTTWEDSTINMVFDYIDQFNDALDKLRDYRDQAEQECSYNNITNNFNNFFTNSVKAYWESEGYTYPWEFAPTIYSIMSYMSTDQFTSLDQTRIYANEVMYSISPETGNLDRLDSFIEIMEDFKLDMFSTLKDGRTGRIEERGDTTKPPTIESMRCDTSMYLSQAVDETAYTQENYRYNDDEEEGGDE